MPLAGSNPRSIEPAPSLAATLVDGAVAERSVSQL
jgi:hypothetical protein